MSDQTLWAVRAGSQDEAYDLFLKKNRIALGWEEIPDLTTLGNDREDFKMKLAEIWPDNTAMSIANGAGQLFRFVHEMKEGDWVAYPAKRDRTVHIGKAVGAYEYAPNINKEYPHQRKVKWLKSFSRTRFSQGALYEIGSALTLFQVRNFADEFLSALEGKAVKILDNEDETVAVVAEEIEQGTRDFILKRIQVELKGHPFAKLVAHLLNIMGYNTRVASPGPDGGVDIIAHRDELGFEPPIIKVQVKSGEGNVGNPEVSALYGQVGQKEHGLLVSLGGYTKHATNFAAGKTNLRLLGSDEFIPLILKYYNQLDSRYKSLIPLKGVFIPESIPEPDE